MKQILAALAFLLVAAAPAAARDGHDKAKIKALIIDGQNNHSAWPKTTVMMKKYLEDTGLFTVDVKRTAFTWKGGKLVEQFPIDGVPKTEDLKKSKADPDFKPDFSKYDVVVSNFGYGAAPWPKETQDNFVKFVKGGGGLVIVHAANNSFGNWPEYNRMIGLGGWGGRNEKSGPYVYIDDSGKEVRDTSKGKCGAHGAQHEFQVKVRVKDHPITKGLPETWLHAKDELYTHLRGPAEKMTLLATAYDKGTKRHEPMMMTIEYGEGRIYHTPMGHADYSMECVGYIVTFTRGTEWAATGKVTQTEVPRDFPTADKSSQRSFGK